MPRTSKYAAVYDLLVRCHHLLERRVEHALKGTNLHVPSYRALELTERSPGITLGEITAGMMVTGGDITSISDRLVKLGLLEREHDRNDRRVVHASVTARGKAQLRRARAAVERELHEARRGMSGPAADQLQDDLDRLEKTLRGMN